MSGGGVLLHFLSPFPSRPHAECSLHSLSPSCNFFLHERGVELEVGELMGFRVSTFSSMRAILFYIHALHPGITFKIILNK